jgi:hypothetical protein
MIKYSKNTKVNTHTPLLFHEVTVSRLKVKLQYFIQFIKQLKKYCKKPDRITKKQAIPMNHS